MPTAKPREIWIVDLGVAVKTRPCLMLTAQPHADDLDVFTVVAHTTALRGSSWELPIPKPWLDDSGAFDAHVLPLFAAERRTASPRQASCHT